MLRRSCSILLLCSCSHVICGISSIDIKIFLGLLGAVVVLNAVYYEVPLEKAFPFSHHDRNLLSYTLLILFIGAIFGVVRLFHLKVLLLFIVALTISLLMISFLSRNKKEYLFLYKFTFILNVSSLLWFVLVKIGLDIDTFQVPHPEHEGSISLSYLGSTNSNLFEDVRPAGIFDEAGSLVFWNLMILGFGNLKGWISARKVFVNLILLLSTGSLYLFLTLITYTVYYAKKHSKINLLAEIAILATILVIIVEILSPFSLVSRLNFSMLLENNRTAQASLILENMNLEIFLLGYREVYEGEDFGEGDASSVFWTVQFIYGLICALVFYVIFIKAIFHLGHKEKFVWAFSFVLLCYHRPYIYNLYWCIPFLMFYQILFLKRKHE